MEGYLRKKTTKLWRSAGGDRQYAKELRSYKAACEHDADLRTFDKNLQERTCRMINTLAAAVEGRVPLFDSLKKVTEWNLENNQEVMKVISNCKEDILENKQLSELVEEYWDNSLQTLGFYKNLEKRLQRVCDRRLPILVALRQSEKETGVRGSRYVTMLEELKIFKAAVDQFAKVFFQMFQSVYHQQMRMQEKLRQRKKKLAKKLKRISVGRKLLNMIFVTTFAALLICSAVAAAMAAPPPVTAALAAGSASIPIGCMLGEWVDSLWKNYENVLKWEEEVISSMQKGNCGAIADLKSIQAMIDPLKIDISALLQSQDSAIKEELAKIGMENIKKKLEEFTMNAEDLKNQVVLCRRNLMQARNMVVQRIMEKPNN